MNVKTAAGFERARTLNRSVRAESKMELASDDTYKSHMSSKWQSVGALTERNSAAAAHQSGQGTAANLNRLKKSYATMRKSFRVQLVDRKRRFNFPSAESSNDLSANEVEHNKSKSSNLIGQIGSGAVKLFRGVYGRSQQSGNINQFQLDSIAQSTNGSFKVLPSSSSSPFHYGETVTKKSNAEQEIEQRLRRSKRRILPSAQYQAPDCEHACDDLDLDELESIKRDNLRLTLRSLKSGEPRNLPPPPPDEVNHRAEIERFRDNQEQNLCSCKNIEVRRDNSQHEQLYCSCLSLESSISITSSTDASFRDPEKPNLESCWSVLVDNDDKDTRRQERKDEEDERVSRASGGFEGEQQIEDELGKIFVGLLREHKTSDNTKTTTGNNNRENIGRLAENVCGEQSRTEDSDTGKVVSSSLSSSSSSLQSYCAYLSLTERENEPRGSEFRVIDGLSELCRLPKRSEANTSQREMNDDDERMQSARNCCKLGGVSSPSPLAECVSQQQQQQQRQLQQASPAAIELPFGMQNNEQQERRQQPKSSFSRTTGGDHGRSEKPNSFGCAKNQTTEATTTLTCCNKSDGVTTVVRALPVATKPGHGQLKRARSLSRRDQDAVECERLEETRTITQRNTAEWRDRAKNMQNQQILWPPRGYNHLTRDTSTMQLGRRDMYQLAMRPEQPEEHLYASIHCTASSPSPERYHVNHNQHHDYVYTGSDGLYYEQSPRWHHHQQQQQQNNHETLMSMNKQELFDKQLNNNHKFESTYKDPMKKKSLFCRIKQLIAPVNNNRANNSGRINSKQDIAAVPPHLSWDYNDTYVKPRGKLSPMHKSATLSSRSTQNLLASSMQYLSTSRKSINHIIESDNNQQDSPATMRKSFINGFLTFGRRTKHGLNKHQSVSEIFENVAKQRSRSSLMAASKLRPFGSADSLHSADSGLSCSNLQNSSSSDENNNYMGVRASDNLYSGGPSSDERVDLMSETNSSYVVVGKAVAKVDCNPCAYDKEALVFRRGDIIDILERDQSGSWIGQCNGQIGHFKFINVTEIPLDEEEEINETTDDDDDYDDEVNVDDGDNKIKADNDKDEKKEGVFITKLVIKSNNNNAELPSPSIRNRTTNNQRCNLTANSRRRSLSMNTIDPSTTTATTTSSPRKACEKPLSNGLVCGGSRVGSGDNCLSNSNETIMSSLEQLLFAIGLAEEKVTGTGSSSISNESSAQRATSFTSIADNNQEKSVAERRSDDGQEERQRVVENKEEQQQQIAHLSYLNVLNEKGINSLDSFSAIDDWHELEQIGIVDDEHQRRLLMAARIIRQASQAAKLDFVQNYRLKPDNQRLSVKEMASVGGRRLETNVKLKDSAITTTTVTTSTTNTIAANNTSQIIGDSARSMPPVVVAAEVETKAKRMDTRNEPVYVNLVSACNESICLSESLGSIDSDKKQLHIRDHRITAGKGNAECLRQRRRPRRPANLSEMSQVYSKQVMGFPSEAELNPINQSDHYHTMRQQRPSLSQEHRQSLAAAHRSHHIEHDQQPHRLVRGYSIRPDIGSFKGQKFNGQTNDDLRYAKTRQYSGNNNYQTRKSAACEGPKAGTVVSQQSNSRAANSHHQVPRKTVYSREFKYVPAPIVSNSQRSQMMILNSKSAYDLRFDLSHFFT